MKKVMVACSQCGGCGQTELIGEYSLTLAQLRAIRGEATAADMARAAGIKATAMSNRLAALERFGLVTSRRWGKKRLYQAKRAAA